VVAASGTKFGANEAVDVYFDGYDLLLAVTNSAGNFSHTFKIPAWEQPGTHWVTAIGRKSGLAAHASFLVRTNWAQFHNGVQHRGFNPFENVLYPYNVAGLNQAWAATTGRAITSSPAVANGVVYVGSEDFNLYAFNATSGNSLPGWPVSTGGFINSSPAVANGVVYIGSGDSNLYAFDAITGAFLWAATTGLFIESPPAVADGTVYVGSDDGNLYAYNLDASLSSLALATRGAASAKAPDPSSLIPNYSLRPKP